MAGGSPPGPPAPPGPPPAGGAAWAFSDFAATPMVIAILDLHEDLLSFSTGPSDPVDMFLNSRQRIQESLVANAHRPLNLEKEVRPRRLFNNVFLF